MVKKTLAEQAKAETWGEINTAIEAASKEELLKALQQHCKKRPESLRA